MFVPARTTSFAHKRRGRCMTRGRYFKKFKKAPPPENCGERISSKGELIQYVKVYQDGSDDSWAFSEASEDAVLSRSAIDDGSMILSDDQIQCKFEAASKLLRAQSGTGLRSSDLPGAH